MQKDKKGKILSKKILNWMLKFIKSKIKYIRIHQSKSQKTKIKRTTNQILLGKEHDNYLGIRSNS